MLFLCVALDLDAGRDADAVGCGCCGSAWAKVHDDQVRGPGALRKDPEIR